MTLYTRLQPRTHTRWQLVATDSTGAPTITDMGGEFRHRDGWDADPVHRGTAERVLCLGCGLSMRLGIFYRFRDIPAARAYARSWCGRRSTPAIMRLSRFRGCRKISAPPTYCERQQLISDETD